MTRIYLPLLTLILMFTTGCLPNAFRQKDMKRTLRDALTLKESEALANFPTGKSQLHILCQRAGQDKIREVFCQSNPPIIRSLNDLQKALGLEFSASQTPGFALLGHSTSLVTQSVSAINPRAFIFSSPVSDFVAMSFTRGEPFVEIVAGDPVTKSKNFFLVAFSQDCDRTNTCHNGDRLTPAIESNWRSFTIYEDEDLKNTILDCRQCHQPHGPGTKKILRMQELELPWTHWFEPNLKGGQALVADFQAAHGTNEHYGGIPAQLIAQSNPPALESFVKLLGDGDQPNVFDSAAIEISGRTGVWLNLFQKFIEGLAIPVPYFGLRVTDPEKLKQMTNEYQKFRNGSISASALPDIREVFSDEPGALADLGFRVRAGQGAQQILVQACAQCHNSSLDQSLSRARFNVDLSKTSLAVRAEAIRRLSLPDHSLLHMPPKRFRSLTPDQINTLTLYLSK